MLKHSRVRCPKELRMKSCVINEMHAHCFKSEFFLLNDLLIKHTKYLQNERRVNVITKIICISRLCSSIVASLKYLQNYKPTFCLLFFLYTIL